jgi:methionine aminotransferase
MTHTAAATTIFTVMSTLAAEHGAINLSQGFPDFPIDPALVDAVAAAMREGFNQYAPMPGLPRLREAIAADFASRYGLQIDPGTEITITPGATYGIFTAFASILSAGDEAIILEPAYDSYIPNIQMCGARAVPVALKAPAFRPDWDEVRAAITPKTKAVIINTPHNPTGTMWDAADWDGLAALVAETGIYVLSDEVYEQLVYDGRRHQSVLQHPGLRGHSFALFSFGKVFHNTGWKMGYAIAPPMLMASFRRLHQFLAFSVNTPMQQGIAAYLESPRPEPVCELLQRKRDFFLEQLKQTPFRALEPAAGSYFQLASIRHLTGKSDRDYAEWLTRGHGVATIPVSAFYSDGRDDGLLRFCFAKKEETLSAATQRLAQVSEMNPIME